MYLYEKARDGKEPECCASASVSSEQEQACGRQAWRTATEARRTVEAVRAGTGRPREARMSRIAEGVS